MAFCNQSPEMQVFSGIRSGDTGSYISCLNLWAPSNGGVIPIDDAAKYCVVIGGGDIRPPPLVGFCVPAQCPSSALLSYIADNATSAFIRAPFHSSLTHGTVKAFCSNDGIDSASKRLGIGMMVVICVIVLIVLFCTVYDYAYGVTDTVRKVKARMSTALMGSRNRSDPVAVAAVQQIQLQQQQQQAILQRQGIDGPPSSIPITVGLDVTSTYRPPQPPSYYKHDTTRPASAFHQAPSPTGATTTTTTQSTLATGSSGDLVAPRRGSRKEVSTKPSTNTSSDRIASEDQLDGNAATKDSSVAAEGHAVEVDRGDSAASVDQSVAAYRPLVEYRGGDAAEALSKGESEVGANKIENSIDVRNEATSAHSSSSQQQSGTNSFAQSTPTATSTSGGIRGMLESLTTNLAKRAMDSSINRAGGGNGAAAAGLSNRSTALSNGYADDKSASVSKREKKVKISDGLSQPLFVEDSDDDDDDDYDTVAGSADEDGEEDDDAPATIVSTGGNLNAASANPSAGRRRKESALASSGGSSFFRKQRELPTRKKSALKAKGFFRITPSPNSNSSGKGKRRVAAGKNGGGADAEDDFFGPTSIFGGSPLSSRFTEYAEAHFTHELEEGDLTRSEKVRTQIALHMEKIIDDIPNINTVFGRFSRCWSIIASFRRWRQHEGISAAVRDGEGSGGAVGGGLTNNYRGTNLRLFNSIRTLCWVWIVVTDTFEYTTQIPTYEGVLYTHTNPAYAFLNRKACDTFAIGTFLMVSGFTVIHQLREEEKRTSKDPVMIAKKKFASTSTRVKTALSWYIGRIVRRWVRLVPLYIAIVFLSQATLLAHDAGAFWPAFLQNSALHGNCVKNFFYTNIFFVNNLAPWSVSERCFPWTFYFALDFQFFAIAPIFHHIHRRTPKWLFYPILALICGGTIYARFATQIACQDKSLGDADVSDSVVPLHSDFTTPWTMLIPYLFGGILCYFHAATINKALEIKMFGPQAMQILRYSFKHTASKQDKAVYWLLERLNSKPFRVLCIWGGLVIALLTLFGSWAVARDYESSCSFDGRIFAAFSVIPWCFGIFFAFLPMLFGYGGAIQRVLTHRLWTNSSKLVFAAYLIHPVVIAIINCIKDHPQTFDALPFAYEVWGNVTLSILAAFLFHLLIEQPFMYMVADDEM